MSFDFQVGNRLHERVNLTGRVLSTFVMLHPVEFISGALPRFEDKSHLLDIVSHVPQMTTVSSVQYNFFLTLREGHHVSRKITVAFLKIYLHVERISSVDSILLPAFTISTLRLSVLDV